MDIVQQMVNEAADARSFQDAAMAVRNHIRSSRDPDRNHALVVGLMAKGYVVIYHAPAPERTLTARQIAHEVMLTLDTNPE